MDIERERFIVTDDRSAEWCLKKIAEADAEFEQMKEWHQQQIESEKKHHDSEVDYFRALLAEYFAKVPKKETKTMSKYALPSGTLVLSKPKSDYACKDADALLSWCKTNSPDLVRVKTEAAWADVKKRLVKTDAGIIDTETGLEVDGVEVVEKPEEFKINMKGE